MNWDLIDRAGQADTTTGTLPGDLATCPPALVHFRMPVLPTAASPPAPSTRRRESSTRFRK